MNILLIFFALPIAVIIFSTILQKIFKCPILVASIIFAIFLVITFVVDNLNFLIATIVYTFISFITAYIVMILCKFISYVDYNTRNVNSCNMTCSCNNTCRRECNSDICDDAGNSNIGDQNIATLNGSFNIGRNGTICTCNQVDNNTIAVSANVIPNNSRTGRFCGTYRRCR